MKRGWGVVRSMPGCSRGRLVRIHRGVYAVGHAQLTPLGWRWAAVLACGGTRPRHAEPPERRRGLGPASFTREVRRHAPSHAAHATAKIRVHRSRTLTARDVVLQDGLALTTVARTIVDLTAIQTPHQTERTVHRAQHLRLLDMHSLDEQLARAQGRPTRWLRAALATLQTDEPQITRSELEERFLSRVLNAQLPRPEVNVQIGPYEVDFFWRAERVIVEVDGRATHLTPQAFENDRHRDADLAMLGYQVLRFTWRQVLYEPALVLRAVEAVLRG